MINCSTCKHRHDVVVDGHCHEFTEMPQTDNCSSFSPDSNLTAKSAGQVTPLTRTGTYLHLAKEKPAAEVPQELRP
jgi:hypothetical protein